MAQAGTVVITLDADTAKLVEGVKRSQKSLSSLEKTVKRSKDTLKSIAIAAGGFYAVKKAIDAATAAASEFVNTNAKFEQFETTLTAISGSSDQARKDMDWIKDFGAKTPYTIDKVTESFVKMKAYGLNPMDGTLKSLGNASGAMGKDITQAVEAMADAVTGENERLKEFGIVGSKVAGDIKYTWVDSSMKSRKIIIENNKDIIQSTLDAIFNEKYPGAMDAQAKTWNGMISNMQDQYTNFQTDVMGGGVFDYLKGGLELTGEIMTEMASTKAMLAMSCLCRILRAIMRSNLMNIK